jgi:hypothetical protein
VSWKTGQFKLQFHRDNHEFVLSLHDDQSDVPTVPAAHSQLLSLDSPEVLLNRNPSKIFDVLVNVKRNILLYAYHRAAALIGIDSFDSRLYHQLRIQHESEEEKLLFTDNCLYARFPKFARVFIVVSLGALKDNLEYREFLSKEFRPSVHLLLDAGKTKKLSIYRVNTEPDVSMVQEQSFPFSAFQNLYFVIRNNTGLVCRYQLLQQLASRDIVYDHAITNGQKTITFALPPSLSSLQTVYPDAVVLVNTESNSSIRWYAEFVIEQITTSSPLPIVVEGQHVLSLPPVNQGFDLFHVQTYDSSTDQILLNPNMCYIAENLIGTNSEAIRILKIRLTYGLAGYQQGFSDFLSDLQAIDKMAAVMLQIVELQKKPATWYRVQMLTHSLIVLDFGKDFQQHLYIFYDQRKKAVSLALSPSHEMQSFFEEFFNATPDVPKLLLLMEHVSLPFYTMREQLSQPRAFWTIIARSVSQVRLIYRKPKYEFIINFRANGTAIIEEAIQDGGNASDKLSLTFSTAEASLLSTTDTLNRYASSIFLFDTIIFYVQQISKNSQPNGRKVIFSNNDITYSVGIDATRLELDFTTTSTTLTDEERQALTDYFQQRVLPSCFSGNAEKILLAFFVNLLRFPTPLLKQVLQAMLVSPKPQPDPDSIVRHELLLVFPPDLKLPKRVQENVKDLNLLTRDIPCLRYSSSELNLVFRFWSLQGDHVDVPITLKQNMILFQFSTDVMRIGIVPMGQSLLLQVQKNYPQSMLQKVIEHLMDANISDILQMN